MNWHTPSLTDLKILQECAVNNLLFGNNYSAVNSFLYSQKLNSCIAFSDGWIFEKYVADGKKVFSFPHNVDGNNSQIANVVSVLVEEAEKSNDSCIFRNVTNEEKDLLLQLYPSADVKPISEAGDYIYLTEKLAELPGSKYSKKRNHINQFLKNYPDYKFEPLSAGNLSKALEVEEKWLSGSKDENLIAEQMIIQKAFENFDEFEKTCGLKGGLLYVKEEPIAFCLASTLSPDVTDVHFEKCIEPYAHAGGYAVINRDFAKTVSTKFLNREEDLGIEGLRKAKLSYYPEMILEKFVVTL